MLELINALKCLNMTKCSGGVNMKFRIPNSYVLLFGIIVILGFLSYIIPAGRYQRQLDPEMGFEYVVADSYVEIDRTPVTLFDLFKAIPAGMMDASDIIIFVLIAGGSFGIIQATGTVNYGIASVVKRFSGKEKKVIILVMVILSLAGAIFGTAEEALVLYPMLISLSIALGFDRMTGVAMGLLGTGSGFVAGFLNPFTTGVAQQIVELPLFSGIVFRMLAYILFVSTSIFFVLRHARKSNADNDALTEHEQGFIFDYGFQDMPPLSRKHKRVLFILGLLFFYLIYGILKKQFYILEIATTFFIMGIVSGLAGGIKSGRLVTEFIKGASSMVYGALIIGVAKGVTVIMTYGNIMDTIIFQLSKIVVGLSPIFSAISMFLIQSVFNIFITSGSGQAAVTMPIMKALADLSDLSRQTAVLAFQFGDGFSNVISPTSGYFMAALAIGGVEWKKWIKWAWPLFATWYVEGIFLLVVAVVSCYGPF